MPTHAYILGIVMDNTSRDMYRIGNHIKRAVVKYIFKLILNFARGKHTEHLSIYLASLSIDLSIHPSILSIYLSVYLSIYLSS